LNPGDHFGVQFLVPKNNAKNGPPNWLLKRKPKGDAAFWDQFWAPFSVPKIVPKIARLGPLLENIFVAAFGAKTGTQKLPPGRILEAPL
jgi:hypothetical protein